MAELAGFEKPRALLICRGPILRFTLLLIQLLAAKTNLSSVIRDMLAGRIVLSIYSASPH